MMLPTVSAIASVHDRICRFWNSLEKKDFAFEGVVARDILLEPAPVYFIFTLDLAAIVTAKSGSGITPMHVHAKF